MSSRAQNDAQPPDRFDAFLQQNDHKAHKAMKVAENTTKRKQDKIQHIKQLRTQLAALQSEITKFREQKDECLRYKDSGGSGGDCKSSRGARVWGQ